MAYIYIYIYIYIKEVELQSWILLQIKNYSNLGLEHKENTPQYDFFGALGFLVLIFYFRVVWTQFGFQVILICTSIVLLLQLALLDSIWLLL